MTAELIEDLLLELRAHHSCSTFGMRCIDALTRLQQEVGALRKDAERYRYAQEELRVGEVERDFLADCHCDFKTWGDADIDAAIARLRRGA